MNLPGLPSPSLESEPEPVTGELVVSGTRAPRVTPAEAAAIAVLETQGLTVPEIAQLLKRNPGTVRANLRHGKDLLKVMVPEAVELWIEAARVAATKGNHTPAKDLVYAAGAAAAGPGAQGPAQQIVNIGIALPGLPQPTRTQNDADSD